MACSGCSTGRGCGTLPAGCKNNGSCGTGGCNKLNVFDWLANMELPNGQQENEFVEIRFKNSRKDFFRNVNSIPLKVGDMVAVEASPGHDIGAVSLTGELVGLQLRKKKVNPAKAELKKVYRKANQKDLDKWQEGIDLEFDTMHKARTLAHGLGLQMKISDVEYQGDKTKAIFYYTADDRVDFRELIKKMADEFKIRIEMRQIGARQEASRLGGIGACGRELCCSTWLTDFRTVSTSAARYQQLSLNPQKLAGQCGKLKCCLNYELDSYMDALKEFPDTGVNLFTEKGKAFHQKTDIFKRTLWYSYTDEPGHFIPLTIDRAKEIIEMNKKGDKPSDLGGIRYDEPKKEHDYQNVVGQDDLTRFDQPKKKKKKKKRKGGGGGQNQGNNNPQGGNQKNNNPQGQGKQGRNRGRKGGNRPPKPSNN